ncbi:MAG: TRAP transporter substrate-binding protein [Rhodobacterales bacterium]|nr:TRAP transporter substrate-binding protein [Rhodobacterales bacterium]
MERRAFLTRGTLGAVTAGVASTLAAPALSQDRKKWRMITTWPKGSPGLMTGAKVVADFVSKASNGRLTVDLYGAGEIVPAFEALNAVASGAVEMGHGYPSYWSGVHPAMNFLAPVPFGLTPQEQYAWFRYGGGNELSEELYNELGLKFFVSGNVMAQGHGWFNREINSIEDYKGLKMRIGGLGGRVVAAAGATVISIPLGEVQQALQTSNIDAAEFVGPLNDLAFGLYQAAKYYYWPGWQEPSGIMDCFINMKEWESLDDDLKEIVRGANGLANEVVMSEYVARNADALQVLTNDHNVSVKYLSSDTLESLAKISTEVVTDEASKSPMSGRIHESMTTFLTKVAPYTKAADTTFLNAREKFIS